MSWCSQQLAGLRSELCSCHEGPVGVDSLVTCTFRHSLMLTVLQQQHPSDQSGQGMLTYGTAIRPQMNPSWECPAGGNLEPITTCNPFVQDAQMAALALLGTMRSCLCFNMH